MTMTENEKFLISYHAKYPGCTPKAMADGLTSNGKSSYELLTSIVPTTSSDVITVLDLACGDGFLLQQLLNRSQPNLRLIGVDMSEGELSAAKHRINNDQVILHQAKAQSIPLKDSSVDYVLCHMAIMLMDSVEEAISEIRRVLKPGGKVSAVVGSKGPENVATDIFVRLLDDSLKAEGLTWSLGLGDRRIRKEEGIRSFFSTASGFVEPVQIEEHVLSLSLAPSQATEFFMLTYDPALLSLEGQSKFERKLLQSFDEAADSDGVLFCPTGMRQFTCEKKQ
jgi:SAM-dependent methyltransferase